jgi:hypothetical protein
VLQAAQEGTDPGFPLEVRDAVLRHLTQGLQRRYTKAAYTNENGKR